MSGGVCAVAMARDELDICEAWVAHTASQVDHIIVADNLSTDGTRELLDALAKDYPLTVFDDDVIAYMQSPKMSALAQRALEMGFSWAVLSDLDEAWMTTDNRPIREFLNGLAPDIRVVTAELFNHIPTAEDDEGEPNPFRRIGWRKRERAPLPKICARLHPSLIVRQGNHSVYLDGVAPVSPGLLVRHFSWRSAAQYQTKIENGSRAYAQTNLGPDVGAHWQMWGTPPDDPEALAAWRETVTSHYWTWFHSPDPSHDASLIFDPAPLP